MKPLDQVKEAGITTADWVDERTSLSGAARWAMFRKVPKGVNWFYTLGSGALFAFLSQAVTGVFLAMYYDPSVTNAYESTRHLTNEVFLGEFVRGMHRWGSSVMIVLVFLHMGRVFFFGAYKYPRELNWLIGVVLLLLVSQMALTGYLLPFDQRSYWATVVAVNINGTGPFVGPVPGGLPARWRRVRRDDAVALLRDPHAPAAGRDRGVDRRAPVPGHAARHHRAAVGARQGLSPRRRPRLSASPRRGRAVPPRRASRGPATPSRRARERRAPTGAVEEPGAAQQVPARAGREQLAEAADRLREQLGRGGDAGERVADEHHRERRDRRARRAEQGLRARHGGADRAHGEGEDARVGPRVALDDVEPAVDDRRAGEADEDRGGRDEPRAAERRSRRAGRPRCP